MSESCIEIYIYIQIIIYICIYIYSYNIYIYIIIYVHNDANRSQLHLSTTSQLCFLLLRRAAETFAQALLQRWADLVFDDLSNASIQVIPDGLDGCIEPPVTSGDRKKWMVYKGKIHENPPFKWMMKKGVNALRFVGANLQETIDFPTKIMGFSCKVCLKPIHWRWGITWNNVR